ncbi:MAG: regulatory protein RecX [Balneolales bacterium]
MPYQQETDEESPHFREVLPGECTSLSLQKKNKNRISVFVKGEYVAGFYQQVILDYKLTVGMTVTAGLLAAMRQSEQRCLIRERCFVWLGRRAHSRHELKKKALQKNFPVGDIDFVLDDLDEKGYLNDQEFAILFAGDKSKIYGWGPQKIRAALFQKGVEKHYIDTALDEAVSLEDMVAHLYRTVRKAKQRFLRTNDAFKRKKKLVDFLQRKGYTLEVILAEAESLLKIIEDDKF